jgi:F-type H+-transporting ATPase subunit c
LKVLSKEMFPVKKLATFALTFVGLLLVAAVVVAQEAATGTTGGTIVGGGTSIDFTKYFGAGLTTCGAAYGIGRLASSALESMARQPEVAGSIQTAMIISAALIEGFTFFALVICFT